MKPCTISNILSQLSADELNELDRKAGEVIRAVEETGKNGEMTLKITLKKNGDNSALIRADLKTKVPVPAPTARVLFFKYDDALKPTGELSELPPKQEPLFDTKGGPGIRAVK
jgi:ribosomal protein S28E/S33